MENEHFKGTRYYLFSGESFEKIMNKERSSEKGVVSVGFRQNWSHQIREDF